jgi:hypothetical protein
VIPLQSVANKLWTKLRSHFRRLTKSIVVSGVLTLVGFSLLWTLTATFDAEGTSAMAINIGLSPVMMFLGFIAALFLVWDDRETEAKKGLKKWTVKSVGIGAFSQSSFAIFVGFLGFPPMIIAAILIGVKAPACYIINNNWIFPNEDSSSK